MKSGSGWTERLSYASSSSSSKIVALNWLSGVLVSAKFAPPPFQAAGPYKPFEDDDEDEDEYDMLCGIATIW
jgi:hypothetical protein